MLNEPVRLLSLGGFFVPSPGVQPIPIDSDWTYDPNDPYAVKMTIHTGGPEPVEWNFARSLLSLGLVPKGDTRQDFPDGDVSVYQDGSYAVIELNSPRGHAVLKFNHAALNTFLINTSRSVPFGTESDSPDEIERELQSILKESNNDY